MIKTVIIGAGQTGRGYVSRFLQEQGYEITFIEEKEALTDLLKADGAFCIHFYNQDRKPIYIQNFNTYRTYSEDAKRAIGESDYIFTAVGEQNLGDVAKQIKEGIVGKTKKTVIVTCENGINPGKVLSTHLSTLGVKEPFEISQTAVFCSTVVVKQTRLDILSQNETYFPYDCDHITNPLELNGAVPIHGFPKFLERKIYTYNCLAGLISYCGYIKGYEVYGDAANDNDISELMDRLLIELNPALAGYFAITLEEQLEFAKKALIKFKDKNILDYVIKNGRDAARKLGPTERIMAPMKILQDHNGDIRILEFIAAAALCYWEELQGNGREAMIKMDSIDKLCELNQLKRSCQIVKNIEHYLYEIKTNRNNINVIKVLFDN